MYCNKAGARSRHASVAGTYIARITYTRAIGAKQSVIGLDTSGQKVVAGRHREDTGKEKPNA